nr:retrotransposon protein, putative, Ty1-copia subclass [Tanacetum cinerariifolium]
MFVNEQPIPPAPAADSEANVLVEWNALYDVHNEVACLMLGTEVERFDLIQTFHACKQVEGESVAAYVLQMKGYVDQLECLGYVLQQDIIVGLILKGLTKDFAGFVRNYNMHNMGKTIGKLHAMLIEYEKGLPKKAKTPQVMMIKCGKIQKAKKESLKAKGNGKANVKGNDKQVYISKPKNPKPYAKDHSAKDDACHHFKEVGHWKSNCLVYLADLLKKKKQVGSASSSGIFTIELFSFPNKSWVYDTGCGTHIYITKQGFRELTPSYTPQHNGVSEWRNRTLLDMVRSMMNLTTLPLSFWDYALESATRILNMIPTKKVDKTPYELWYGKVLNLFYLKVWGCEALVKRDTPDKLQQRSVKCIFIGYPKETTRYYFYFPLENKIVVVRYAEFFEKNLITQEVLVDLPPGCKTAGSKWIFKKKTDMDGIVHTYKARLVAKGYTQLYGVDYKETFSPVAYIRAIRILISIAAFYHYEIWQMYVKTTFLNGYLAEDIYMVQPEGFVDPNHPRKVCKLQRSIYGLKQASRSWNKRFDKEIKRFGFAQNLDEPCVYQKAGGSNVTFLILYVDDIIIMGNHIPSLQSVKDYLGKCFAMKDLREVAFILGIKIYRDRTQGASTPKEVKRMQNVPYASAVGSIIDDTKSQTGYVFILNGGAMDWKSSKQSTTAMSTTEAEYIATMEAAIEAVWIRMFISELGIVPTINEHIRMFYDNSAALHFVNEPGVQKGTRHYHRRYHYVRKCIALGEIRFLKVHIDDNVADPFTKALCNTNLT